MREKLKYKTRLVHMLFVYVTVRVTIQETLISVKLESGMVCKAADYNVKDILVSRHFLIFVKRRNAVHFASYERRNGAKERSISTWGLQR